VVVEQGRLVLTPQEMMQVLVVLVYLLTLLVLQ
jgi:hypothetical protein